MELLQNQEKPLGKGPPGIRSFTLYVNERHLSLYFKGRYPGFSDVGITSYLIFFKPRTTGYLEITNKEHFKSIQLIDKEIASLELSIKSLRKEQSEYRINFNDNNSWEGASDLNHSIKGIESYLADKERKRNILVDLLMKDEVDLFDESRKILQDFILKTTVKRIGMLSTFEQDFLKEIAKNIHEVDEIRAMAANLVLNDNFQVELIEKYNLVGVEGITNEEILMNIARSKSLAQNFIIEAIKKIKNQDFLHEVALNTLDNTVRKVAIDKLTKEEFLISIARSKNLANNFAIEALKKITNQGFFHEIALNNSDSLIRIEAIDRMNIEKKESQLVLEKIAKYENIENIRFAAIKKVTDINTIVDLYKNEKVEIIKIWIISNKFGQREVENLFDVEKNSACLELIIKKIVNNKNSSQDTLFKIIDKTKNLPLLELCIKNFSQTDLFKVIDKTKNLGLLELCVNKFTDKPTLNTLMLLNKNWNKNTWDYFAKNAIEEQSIFHIIKNTKSFSQQIVKLINDYPNKNAIIDVWPMIKNEEIKRVIFNEITDEECMFRYATQSDDLKTIGIAISKLKNFDYLIEIIRKFEKIWDKTYSTSTKPEYIDLINKYVPDEKSFVLIVACTKYFGHYQNRPMSYRYGEYYQVEFSAIRDKNTFKFIAQFSEHIGVKAIAMERLKNM